MVEPFSSVVTGWCEKREKGLHQSTAKQKRTIIPSSGIGTFHCRDISCWDTSIALGRMKFVGIDSFHDSGGGRADTFLFLHSFLSRFPLRICLASVLLSTSACAVIRMILGVERVRQCLHPAAILNITRERPSIVLGAKNEEFVAATARTVLSCYPPLVQ